MKSMLKGALAALAISVALPAAALAAGFDVNVTTTDLALRGYDPVSYFTDGAPTPGEIDITAEHQGAIYRFASAEHKAMFEADPAKYAPQYGGYCAMGAALGKKLDVDPSQYKVVDGKLYLNVNADVFKKWSEDVPGNIAKANANWPAIQDKAANTL